MSVLEELWARVSTPQPPLPVAVVLVLGLVALVVTWSPAGYRLVRHLVTLVHEAGHALVAVLTGRRLRGIRLHSDTSGLTVSRGRPRGLGMVATLAAGYPAPALLGLAGAWLLGRGYAAGLLGALLLTCVLMLLMVRNGYGAMVLLVTGAAVGVVIWAAPQAALSWTGHLLVWALVLAAPRSVVELQLQRRAGRAGGSDVEQLGRLTHLPAVVWIAGFWAVCALCLLGTAALLLGRLA